MKNDTEWQMKLSLFKVLQIEKDRKRGFEAIRQSKMFISLNNNNNNNSSKNQ